MGSATRCHFVNPKYDELHGQPCYPSLDAPARSARTSRIVALNPLRAASVTEAAAAAGVPAVIIPGGGVVEGGAAAAAMQAEVGRDRARARHRARRPELHGRHRPGRQQPRPTSATSRRTCRAAASPGSPSRARSPTRSSSPGSRVGFSRIISCGSEVVLDVCDYLAYCLDDPETNSVILFVEGFKRPERFLALADRALELGKPIMAVKVGPQRAGAGRRRRPLRVARGRGPGDRCGARRGRRHPLRGPRRAARDGRAGRGHRAGPGRSRRPRPDRGRDGLDRRGVAHRRPSAGRPGVDLPPIPAAARAAILAALPTMGYIGNPLDPWGAADPATAYGAAFEAMAASGRVRRRWCIVHDFPYRSLPSEVATANEVTAQLLAATARPARDPAGLRLADVGRAATRDQGPARRAGRRGAAPARRPSRRSRAIASVARWEGRRDLRREGRAVAGGLAGARRGPTSATARTRRRCPPAPDRLERACPSATAWPSLGDAGIAVTDATFVPDAASAVAAARRFGRPVALKLEATGLTHKSDHGGVVARARGR